MAPWWFGENNRKIVLFGKNGPSHSKSGHSLGGVTKVSACSSDAQKVMVETEEKCLSLDISNFSAIEESTPLPKKRTRTVTKAKDTPPKRQALIPPGNMCNADLKEKCLGEYRIPVHCLREPPSNLLLRPLNQRHKDKIKEGLKDTRSCSTVLPVLLVGETFDSCEPEASEYYTLGGNHLASAIIKDLSDDSAITELTTVNVKVFSELNKTEALRVASLHNVGTHLVQGGNLSNSVSVCRRLLYILQGYDAEELKSLEPTFQLAQYSIRCYNKLLTIFEHHEERTGQCLKQTAFMKLQGLPETTKFDLLSEVVSGSYTVKEMAKEAEKIKKLLVVQKELMAQLALTSWEDADRMYPLHTQEKAIQPFYCNYCMGIFGFEIITEHRLSF